MRSRALLVAGTCEWSARWQKSERWLVKLAAADNRWQPQPWAPAHTLDHTQKYSSDAREYVRLCVATIARPLLFTVLTNSYGNREPRRVILALLSAPRLTHFACQPSSRNFWVTRATIHHATNAYGLSHILGLTTFNLFLVFLVNLQASTFTVSSFNLY